MNFYYNADLNICADENWVIEYILNNEGEQNWEEVYSGLRSCREYYGWFDCEVSNSIAEKFEVQLIGY